MGFDLETVNRIVNYPPLWVALIVVSVTQIGKIWLRAAGATTYHRLLTRLISACVGSISGFLVIEHSPRGAVEGLAIAVTISIIYVPLVRYLRSTRKGWAVSLADWLSGK